MSSLLRFFCVLTIVTLLALASGCSSCDEQVTRDREPLSLIPADAWIVATVKMGPVRSSSAYKRIIKQQGNLAEYYIGQCSYDPLIDIERIWVGGGDDAEKGRGAIIAFGSVDREKVLDCYREQLRKRGLSLDEVDMEGFTVYTPGPGRPHLAWLDSKTLVVADRENARKVLALEKGKGKSVRSNEKLFKLWERTSQGRDISVATLAPERYAKRVASLLPNSYGAIGETKQANLGLVLTKGLDLLISLRLGSGESAEKLTKRLKRDIEEAQDNNYIIIAGLAGHLKTLNVENAGPEIAITAHLNDRQLDTLTRIAVDSIDEVMRDGPDPEKALRKRLRGEGKRGGDAGVDGGLQKTGDGAPVIAEERSR